MSHFDAKITSVNIVNQLNYRQRLRKEVNMNSDTWYIVRFFNIMLECVDVKYLPLKLFYSIDKKRIANMKKEDWGKTLNVSLTKAAIQFL